jgi:hypothetical protein
MKKSISLLVAALVMFAMTAVSFAENSADINVTSEPIRWHAECDKAGGLAISFDHGTEFVSGDQITADLPLNVSLCRNIDFIAGIARGGADPLPYSSAFVLPGIGDKTLGPLTATPGGVLASTDGGVVFWVHGTIGSQRIYIDILSDSDNSGVDRNEPIVLPTLTFDGSGTADEQSAKLVLNILDQAVYTSPSGLFTDRDINVAPAAVPGTAYDLRTVAGENTLCINVSEYNNEYVKLSFDSKDDKYKWVPSDPQVAHVVPPMTIGFAPCSKNECGRIIEPTPGEQTAGVCSWIDNEGDDGSFITDYATIADGYCPGTHRNNRLVIQEQSGRPFDAGMYQIQLEILVDGQTGDQGVYFAGPIGYNTATTSTLACNVTAGTVPTIYYNALNESNVYQIDASGTNTALTPGSDTDCEVAAINRITKVKTQEISLFNGTDEDFLFVDIPLFIWDSTLFTSGELLEVRVTLLKAPCGTLFSGEWCIGTLGCETTVDPGLCYEYSRVFPYFGAAGAFANYMSITNTSSSAVTYTVEIFEKDGDQFTATVMVGAQSLAVVNLHSLAVTTVSSAGGGVFGDVQSYAIVKGSAAFYGGAYMINSTSGQAFDAPIGDISHRTVTFP